MKRSPRLFIIKHPCNDQPTIMGVDPDPRSGDSLYTFDGPDYSGYYIREPRWLSWLRKLKT